MIVLHAKRLQKGDTVFFPSPGCALVDALVLVVEAKIQDDGNVLLITDSMGMWFEDYVAANRLFAVECPA